MTIPTLTILACHGPGGLAELAQAEFADRRASARAKVARGALSEATAEALLRPFAALVIRLGGDVPGLAEAFAEERNPRNLIAGVHVPADERDLRVRLAEDLAPFAAIRVALANARDAALRKAADPVRAERLAMLAAAIGCEPVTTPEREAA